MGSVRIPTTERFLTVPSLFSRKVSDNKANSLFLAVRDGSAYQAARTLMDQVFADFGDKDGNFIKDFQTTGFSGRVWELSLFAFLQETGLNLDRSHRTPDYLVAGPTPLAVEAATSQPPESDSVTLALKSGTIPQVPADLDLAQAEFVFQFGKTLRRKLIKRFDGDLPYWYLPQVQGKPFVLAAQSFHSDSSLFHSGTFAAEYLYGMRWNAQNDSSGALQIASVPIESHHYNGRSIPSGLFAQDEARHLSAVIFSNAGTVAQFNRIGTQRGLGADDTYLVRSGTCVSLDPDASMPFEFHYLVGSDLAPEETFSQGIHVLHNPFCDEPLDDGSFGAATEHRLDISTGQVVTTHVSSFSPIGSVTYTLAGPGAHAKAMSLFED